MKRVFESLAMSMLLLVCTGFSVVFANFGAKFEPPDGSIYSGGGQQPESIAAIQNHGNSSRQPTIVATYDDIGNSSSYSPPAFLIGLSNMFPGAKLQVGLNLPNNNLTALTNIGNGTYDSDLHKMAAVYKGLGVDVFLRIGYEFNESWTAYNQTAYISAFQHIVSLFRTDGVTNVAFVWDASNAGNVTSLMNWYPGDTYVDWFAFNALYQGNLDPTYISGFMSTAGSHSKPVMIGELSFLWLDYTDSTWVSTFNTTFSNLRASGVKGYQLIHFNWPVIQSWAGYKDEEFTNSSTDVVGFNTEMSNASYLHRDSTHFNPNVLAVDAAREILAASSGSPWVRSMDSTTTQSGYNYSVNSATVYRDASGWTKGWQNGTGTNNLAFNLTVPTGSSGKIVVDFDSTIGTDLYIGSRRVVAGFLTSNNGVVNVEVQMEYSSSDSSSGTITVKAQSSDGTNQTIQIEQIRVQAVSASAPSVPGGLSVGSATPPALSWSAVTGADRYNVYRNGVLIGSATSTSYTDNNPLATTAYYAVSAYSKSNGEGWMSASVAHTPSTAVTVNFTDRPTAVTALTGVYKNIDWGNSDWVTQYFSGWGYYADVNSASTTPVTRTFTLPAGAVLQSITVAGDAGATISLSQPGTSTAQFTLATSYSTFNTGWTTATGAVVTVTIADSGGAYNTAISALSYYTPTVTVNFADRPTAVMALTGIYKNIDWGSSDWVTQYFSGWGYYADVNSASTTPVTRTFTLPAGGVLQSITVSGDAGATISLSQPGTSTAQFTLATSYSTFNTGWTTATGAAVTVTISDSGGAYNTAISALSYN